MIVTARGAKTYNTGNPCPQGHVGERYVSSRNCVACVRERTRLRKLAHPELHRKQMQLRYIAKKVQLNAQCKHYYDTHKEQITARRRELRAERQLQSNQEETA